MSSIPQNHSDEKALIDCVQRFFSKHHIGVGSFSNNI